MIEVRQTDVFAKWIKGLRDVRAKARIADRIERLKGGNAGDVKPVGEGISEMKINYGPGYRVYFMTSGREIVILLCGGDKSTQDKDIKLAKKLAKE